MFNRIGVIGAGAMGRGIAQLFASSGQEILLYDTRAEAIDEAIAFNRNLLQRSVAKGKLSEADFEATMGRMQPAAELAQLQDCDLVIEAIVEILEVKQKLFAQLEAIVREDCVLATNTSSLSVTRIASTCTNPERVAGFHFFNPVPLMRIVEVVRGERTDERYIQGLVDLANKAGHFPAITPDTPGFLVNHAGRAFGTEALRMLSEGVATPQQIDRILRDGPGFRMGPFELFDLTGLDVSHAVMESVYEQFYHDPRYTPSFIAAQRVAAGLLGRKTAAASIGTKTARRSRSRKHSPRRCWSIVRSGCIAMTTPFAATCMQYSKRPAPPWKPTTCQAKRPSAWSHRWVRTARLPCSTSACPPTAPWRSTCSPTGTSAVR